MKLLAKVVLLGLAAGATATAVHGDPAGGWLSPNGTSAGAVPAAPTTQTTSGTPAAQANGTASGGVAVGVSVTLSLADIQTRTHQLHDQIRVDARHIQHLQQIARKEKDVIKLNCVNDKLVQVKPQMNLFDLGEGELEAARDSDRMGIFDGLAQAADTIRRLREEADQCIGEPVGSGGESSNSFSGPRSPDDPTRGFAGNEIEPPGYASPFN